MDSNQIEQYLSMLGEELQKQGVKQPVRLLLIGGAFMLTQIHNRHSTNDIDVLLKDTEDPQSPMYRTFKSAVRTVAANNNLSTKWLNDVIGDFLRDAGEVPKGKLWKKFSGIEVYLPPKEYILAHKLLAGREKDENDILALSQQLKIKTRAQAQKLVEKYIPDKQLHQLHDLDNTLDRFF